MLLLLASEIMSLTYLLIWQNLTPYDGNLATHAGGSWNVGSVLSGICDFGWGVKFCPPSKRITTWASNTKLGTHNTLYPITEPRHALTLQSKGQRECHLWRVAGNTVWSHMAREFPQRCGACSTNCYTLPYLTLPYLTFATASPLGELACHMGSHSNTRHPIELTFPPLPRAN